MITENLRSKAFHFFFAFLFIASFQSLFGQTIAEKKASLHRGGSSSGAGELDPETQALLSKVNLDLSLKKAELHKLYSKVIDLHSKLAPPESFQCLLSQST